jgi:hypothetical protein
MGCMQSMRLQLADSKRQTQHAHCRSVMVFKQGRGKKPSGKPSLCEDYWNAHRLDSSCRTDQIPDPKNLVSSPLNFHI